LIHYRKKLLHFIIIYYITIIIIIWYVRYGGVREIGTLWSSLLSLRIKFLNFLLLKNENTIVVNVTMILDLYVDETIIKIKCHIQSSNSSVDW